MQDIGQIIKDENEKIAEENKIIAERKSNDEKFIPKLDLKVIAQNAIMSCSLEKLTNNLPSDKFTYTDIEFGEGASLLKKKGVYPYDYMDSFDKFKRKKLPCKADFYSLLTDEDISDDDYNHAKDVWNTFGIKNMGEYHDLYLKSDILLLADVFENFREASQANYGLDPTHYLTSPGLAWDAMLKMTKINLDLITDIDMQLFIEKGMRGGISYIAQRHAVANNKYMENYNEREESSYIMYLDANNLYGWAMSKPLPYRNFKWVENKPREIEDLLLYINTKFNGIGKIYEMT